MARDEESFYLKDGRRLGYALLGDPEGVPLYFFHGTPGSRLEYDSDDDLARIPGLRLVLPERPGYGLSDPKPERTLSDWADDVAELADHLGDRRFAVGGISGGGPHALACAHRLADRLTATLVLASPAPSSSAGGMSIGNRLGMLLGRWAAPLLRLAMNQQAKAFERDPEQFLDGIAQQMGGSDREMLKDPKLRNAVTRSLREAYRQGGEASFVDGKLGLGSQIWSFSLKEITAPVHLWYGEEDRLVSRAMAEHLDREIPRSTMRYVAGAGHLLTENESVLREMQAVLGL